jgi:hypothetical protein
LLPVHTRSSSSGSYTLAQLLSNESNFLIHSCSHFFLTLICRRQSVQKRREDSDEDVCALSKNWTFEPKIRRWSRVGEMGPLSLNLPKAEASKTSSRESTPEE